MSSLNLACRLFPQVTVKDTVPINGVYNKKLPAWDVEGKVVAVVSALALSSKNVTIVGSGISGPRNVTFEHIVLKQKSMTDVTGMVGQDGTLSATFPRLCDDYYYRIFAFYERRTLNRNLHFNHPNPATIWDYGSFTVDHFSGRGAQTTIDFWDNNILSDHELKEKLIAIGNYGKSWIDPSDVIFGPFGQMEA